MSCNILDGGCRFLVYNKTHGSRSGGNVSLLPQIRLENDLSGLPLVLGLLCDWVRFMLSLQMFDLISRGRFRMGRNSRCSFVLTRTLQELQVMGVEWLVPFFSWLDIPCLSSSIVDSKRNSTHFSSRHPCIWERTLRSP